MPKRAGLVGDLIARAGAVDLGHHLMGLGGLIDDYSLWGGVAAALAAVLGKRIIDSQSNSQRSELPPQKDFYQGWEHYQFGRLPSEVIVKIGEDLALDKTYPGFAEVADLVKWSQTDPAQLKRFTPEITDPIEFRLSDTTQEMGAIATLDGKASGQWVQARLKDKQSGAELTGVLGQTDRIAYTVHLTNGLASHFIPDVFKQLLIVKEMSHFLYAKQQADLIAEQVLAKFEIIEPKNITDLPTLLRINGNMRVDTPQIPSLGDFFDNATLDLDGAGYFHTSPAFGKIRSQGLFTTEDLRIFGSNNLVFETAKKRGWLAEKARGEFTWKAGLDPFQPEWTKMMRTFFKTGNVNA